MSAGNIDVSSHCRVKFAVAFQFGGVEEGAAGYSTDEAAGAAVTDDVAAACRGSSPVCRLSTNSSSFLPKSTVIELKVLFHGTLTIERMMT